MNLRSKLARSPTPKLTKTEVLAIYFRAIGRRNGVAMAKEFQHYLRLNNLGIKRLK